MVWRAPKAKPIGEASRTRDLPPEHRTFKDTGCHVHPSCLNCPLEVCIHDRPTGTGARATEADANRERVSRALERGLTPKQIEVETGLSERTVYRHLRDLRTPKRSRNIAFEHGGWR